MTYYETFVAPVPRDKLDGYFALSTQMAPMWKAHGVLSIVETRPENVPMGKLASFPQAVQCGEDEVPVFGFMTFHDRAHRDCVMELAVADPAMGGLMMQVPLDGTRMIFGGFAAEIEG
ncbi:DUF1428 domain-containing protein [Pseudorhodobacter ferrugineus]|uniref:DUF1428 domain-containing protein n=1 Tax=Pseudorhodobacter ferrugineus TaxID=77008 RepID=UPI0003B66ABA|nr:DUF1428 domain-containing protein [Pseudorhodobacter ferrugineus]